MYAATSKYCLNDVSHRWIVGDRHYAVYVRPTKAFNNSAMHLPRQAITETAIFSLEFSQPVVDNRHVLYEYKKSLCDCT